ncbi:interleukin 15, like isoform X2 [Enoplosus armatus]|uniref:interleukin 15, like isoform X2 n=1 Tax=Enoplosus armatus TaxID=215367 RepID=UPI0039924128
MLRGRLALVTVCLCLVCLRLVCLLALPAQPATRLCTQDLIKKVNRLIRRAPSLKWLDCRLYTPTVDDYQNCPSSTLKCFADELKVLVEEWETAQGVRLNTELEKLALLLFNQTESECRQCELLQEENAERFLRGLHSTLEMMNSQYSSCSHRGLSKKTS